MGDRPRSTSKVRTSEDKVCRKVYCWSVGADYVLVDTVSWARVQDGRIKWQYAVCKMNCQ